MVNKKQLMKKFEQERRENLISAIEGTHSVVLILDHLKSGFNIGKILRSAEVFSAREIHVIGTNWFNPYPARGSFKRVVTHFHQEITTALTKLEQEGYHFFSFAPRSELLLTLTELPKKSAFILGHEELGLISELPKKLTVRPLSIPQYGQCESLNVSIAASLGLYEYIRQHPQ